MSMFISLLIIFGCGVAVSQDAVASLCFYNGLEGRKNQAFRIVRLVIGVVIMVVSFKMVEMMIGV